MKQTWNSVYKTQNETTFPQTSLIISWAFRDLRVGFLKEEECGNNELPCVLFIFTFRNCSSYCYHLCVINNALMLLGFYYTAFLDCIFQKFCCHLFPLSVIEFLFTIFSEIATTSITMYAVCIRLNLDNRALIVTQHSKNRFPLLVFCSFAMWGSWRQFFQKNYHWSKFNEQIAIDVKCYWHIRELWSVCTSPRRVFWWPAQNFIFLFQNYTIQISRLDFSAVLFTIYFSKHLLFFQPLGLHVRTVRHTTGIPVDTVTNTTMSHPTTTSSTTVTTPSTTVTTPPTTEITPPSTVTTPSTTVTTEDYDDWDWDATEECNWNLFVRSLNFVCTEKIFPMDIRSVRKETVVNTEDSWSKH